MYNPVSLAGAPAAPPKVICLWGGPGSGKSTTRAGVFYQMKLRHLKVEEAPEHAKDLTYEGNNSKLSNQWLVTGEQDRRLRRLEGQVDWIVTDSPLPLALIYGQGVFAEPWFHEAVWNLFDSYDNINVFVERVKPYQSFGRSQAEDEARLIDRRLRSLVADRCDLYVPGDETAIDRILGFLGLDVIPKQVLAKAA